jgi:hypothetical protein
MGLGLTAEAFAVGGGAIVTADPSKHVDPKDKMPSEYTVELQEALRATLPFDDEREVRRVHG